MFYYLAQAFDYANQGEDSDETISRIESLLYRDTHPVDTPLDADTPSTQADATSVPSSVSEAPSSVSQIPLSDNPIRS